MRCNKCKFGHRQGRCCSHWECANLNAGCGGYRYDDNCPYFEERKNNILRIVQKEDEMAIFIGDRLLFIAWPIKDQHGEGDQVKFFCSRCGETPIVEYWYYDVILACDDRYIDPEHERVCTTCIMKDLEDLGVPRGMLSDEQDTIPACTICVHRDGFPDDACRECGPELHARNFKSIFKEVKKNDD